MSHQNSTEWRKIIRFMFLYFYVFQQKLKYMCLQYLSSLFPYPYLQYIIHTQQIYIPYVCVCVSSSVVDCSLPGSFVHGILQARILEWAAISFSWGSSRPRDQTWVSCFTMWATREVHAPFMHAQLRSFYTLTLVIMQLTRGWPNLSSPNWKTYLKKIHVIKYFKMPTYKDREMNKIAVCW